MKTIACILAIACASCGVPIAVAVEGDHGVYSYSAKSGLTVAILAASIRATK